MRDVKNPDAPYVAPAAMALSAFTSELFLKCLLLLERKAIDRVHSLNVLYRKLSPNQKRRIDEAWEVRARPEVEGIVGCLTIHLISQMPLLRADEHSSGFAMVTKTRKVLSSTWAICRRSCGAPSLSFGQSGVEDAAP